MEIHDKAKMLQHHLGFPEWLTTIGIGKDEETNQTCLYVYVKKLDGIKVPNTFMEVPIKVKLMGDIIPAIQE